MIFVSLPSVRSVIIFMSCAFRSTDYEKKERLLLVVY